MPAVAMTNEPELVDPTTPKNEGIDACSKGTRAIGDLDLSSLGIVGGASGYESSSPLSSTTCSPVIARTPLSPALEERASNDCSLPVFRDADRPAPNVIANANANTNTNAHSNANAPGTHNTRASPQGRSVFSRYWKKTGQQPIPLRSMRSVASTREPGSPAFAIRGSHPSFPGRPRRRNDTECNGDDPVLRWASNADLLEMDEAGGDDDSCRGRPFGRGHSVASCAGAVQGQQQPSNCPSPARRSILPVAPLSHPALRTTSSFSSSRRSSDTGNGLWRKSVSLPCVETHHHRLLTPSDKNLSMPRLAPAPGASCLRPFQKYSPHRKAAGTPGTDASVSSSAAATTVASWTVASIQMGLQNSSSSSLASSNSVVSFLDAVDVRHFETPRETYAQKGWSEYFG